MVIVIGRWRYSLISYRDIGKFMGELYTINDSIWIIVRKGGGVLRSKKLNDVGKAELKDSKLDYSEEANIKTLPYVDYK